MSDLISRLTESDLAELSALADGTLPDERRAAVEARVEASPELQELVDRQRQAVAATRSLSGDRPSPSLEAAVGAGRPERSARARRPRLALASVAAAAAVAATVVLLLGNGPEGPSFAAAARFAAESPTEPAPPARPGGTRLAIAVEGVSFPDFGPAYGWRTLGARRGRVDGRGAALVLYGKDGRRLAYVILAGAGLPRPSGAATEVRRGVPYDAVRLNGRLAVTWRRSGHTCLLIGDAARLELVKLASWPLTATR